MKLPFYRRYFSRSEFWAKLGQLARVAGTQTLYRALLLYYAYERKDTPKWAKRTVLGALGYLLMPLDAIPDLTPILGYTDDFTVLGLGLATVAAYINGDVRKQARNTLRRWLPEPDEEELRRVEDEL
jgi:uncharacterized membrane protein YkvA (DUF1232 family)